MQRYFIELSYNGQKYHGWQRQLNAVSVQETIEQALSIIIQKETQIVGCGRTDSGVHAKQYYVHLDLEREIDVEQVRYKLNRMLPDDIAIRRIFLVSPDSHARYDATSRTYRYYINFTKSPFQKNFTYEFPFSSKCDWEEVKHTALLIGSYDTFFPFCKSDSGVDNYKVDLAKLDWDVQSDSAVFTIEGNRFLRGMVRLVVGACLNVGIGQVDKSEIKEALDKHRLLSKSWSVPPQGLFLEKICYSFIS